MADRAGMLELSAVGGKEAGTLNKEHLHMWWGGSSERGGQRENSQRSGQVGLGLRSVS